MIKGAVNKLFQLAYVTNDFERGLGILKKQLGIRDFLIMPSVVVTQVNGKEVKLSAALAYVGQMMHELIQPEGGDDGVYRRAFTRDGFDLTFHHLGMLIDTREEYDRLMAAHSAAGNGIELNGLFGAKSRFFYTRVEDLRHHLEYVWLDATEQSFFDGVPHN